MSTDNSYKIIKSFKKKIKFYRTQKKTKFGSLNQINAYYKGFLKSKGDIIFFLDSDDFFVKSKIKKNLNFYKKNRDVKILFDLPILKYKNISVYKKFKQKKFLISSWPRFSPQSCISLRREYALELFKVIKLSKFKYVWMDFRIILFLKFNKISVILSYLTYYSN